MEKALREKKMGAEIILLYFYICYSFVHKLSLVDIYISRFLLYFSKFLR
jgi:hypothetical protein